MNNTQLGFFRGLALAVIAAACEFIAQNIGASGLVSASLAGIIMVIVSTIEHSIEQSTAKGLFGTTYLR